MVAELNNQRPQYSSRRCDTAYTFVQTDLPAGKSISLVNCSRYQQKL